MVYPVPFALHRSPFANPPDSTGSADVTPIKEQNQGVYRTLAHGSHGVFPGEFFAQDGEGTLIGCGEELAIDQFV